MPRSRPFARTAAGAALVVSMAASWATVPAVVAAPGATPAHVTRLAGKTTQAAHHSRVNARTAAANHGLPTTKRGGSSASGPSAPPARTAGIGAAALPPRTLATFSASPDVSSVGYQGASTDSLPCGSTPCDQAAHSSVAVGPYDVVQTTSVGFRMTDRQGNAPFDFTYGDFAGLNSATAAGVEGRVVYDSSHDRWIAAYAGWHCDGTTNSGSLSIAISDSTDPQWFWDIWTYSFGQFVPVTPSIGTSNNKIAVAVGRSAIPASGEPCFAFGANTSSTESSLFVVDWSTILSLPSSLPTFQSGWEPNALPWVLARTEGGPSSSIVYGVDRTPDPSAATRLLRISGTVATSITPTATDLTGGAILGLDSPPLALARDGSNLAIASDATCTPAGASGPFACVRLTRMTPTGSAVVDDLTIGRDGYNDVAPAVAVADDGTVHVVYDEWPTGPSAFVTVSSWTFHIAPGAPAGQVSAPALIAFGPDTYAGGHQPGGMTGIASDPSDSHAVWQAYEYAGDPNLGGGWTTWISKLTTGVASAPAGTVTLEANRPKTHALAVHLSAIASTGTQLLVSSSSIMSAGKLSAAALTQPTADLRWDLSDGTFGGSSATGTRHVYVQFGDGAGAWSAVVDTTISYPGPPAVIRRSGSSRYATAAAVATNEYSAHVPVVYIATGLNFPDALAGAGAAGFTGGPILLVTPSLPIPAPTASALTFLQPDQIVVLGGTGAVSDAVRSALAAYTPGGAAAVSRISGASRFATAAAVSAATYAPGVQEVLIATGSNFPDALAGAAVAGKLGDPLLLVTASSIPAATAAELTRLKPHRITVLGGTGVVGSAVLASLFAYTDGGVFRIAGSSRYETAAFIAEVYSAPQPTLALVATGLNFPDALAGAALAGRLSSPILLVAPGSIPNATGDALDYLEPPEIDVLGGTGAVSAGVATQLGSFIVP